MLAEISTADAATVVAAIVDVALFIITVWLARLTKKNVKAAADSVSATNKVVSATNKLIDLQAEPYVYIDASWEQLFLDRQHLSVHIMIKNRGGSPARDIKITDVRDDFPVGLDAWKKTFKELEIVTNGLKELAPDQDMVLARLVENGAWRKHPPSKIFFEYKTVSCKSKDGSSIIDFGALATVYESPLWG